MRDMSIDKDARVSYNTNDNFICKDFWRPKATQFFNAFLVAEKFLRNNHLNSEGEAGDG